MAWSTPTEYSAAATRNQKMLVACMNILQFTIMGLRMSRIGSAGERGGFVFFAESGFLFRGLSAFFGFVLQFS